MATDAPDAPSSTDGAPDAAPVATPADAVSNVEQVTPEEEPGSKTSDGGAGPGSVEQEAPGVPDPSARAEPPLGAESEAPADTAGRADEGGGKYDIPSSWAGAHGDEPAVSGPAKDVDDVKMQAVDKKPADGLQVGEYSKDDWENRDQDLPTTTPDGTPITYTEYDRDPYDGDNRNGARIVAGSDGTHYSTDDHYKTLTRFR